MAAKYGPPSTGAGRLRAVLEGRVNGGPVLTAEQRREVDEIRASWERPDGEVRS